jgi:hypothetical protein
MNDKKISWDLIHARLNDPRNPHDQKWLGDRLGVNKNVVSNWKKRGGVPVQYARAVSDVLGVSLDELLGVSETPSTGHKHRLSDEAIDLILWVVQLDRLGDLSRKTFAAHKGLLQLSAAAANLQDFPRAQDSAEEIAVALAERMQLEEPHDERHRT